jgi:uridine kinase
VRPTPLVIGVAGGSGSGKTTVVRNIIEALGDGHVSVLEHDRYYRDHPELRLEDRAALNYDHPDALETDLLVRHVEALRAGRAVEVPTYDFSRHARRSTTDRVEPRTAIIVEGILIFTDAALRRLMDVIDQYLSTVKPMHLEFAEPSKRYADVIIPSGGHNVVAIDMLLTLIRSLSKSRSPEVS